MGFSFLLGFFVVGLLLDGKVGLRGFGCPGGRPYGFEDSMGLDESDGFELEKRWVGDSTGVRGFGEGGRLRFRSGSAGFVHH